MKNRLWFHCHWNENARSSVFSMPAGHLISAATNSRIYPEFSAKRQPPARPNCWPLPPYNSIVLSHCDDGRIVRIGRLTWDVGAVMSLHFLCRISLAITTTPKPHLSLAHTRNGIDIHIVFAIDNHKCFIHPEWEEELYKYIPRMR